MAWAGDVSTANELKNAFTTGSDHNVTLTSDINLTETILLTETRSIELDLNGHSITAQDCRAFWVKSGSLVIKSTDGTGTISTVGTIASNSSVIRVGDADVNVNEASLNIQEGVTIATELCYGVTVFGKNNNPQTLIVNGAIHTKISSAVSGNGNSDLSPTNITISETAEITTTNDVAIYHPQSGTLTVNGKVTGAGGIEMKGGQLVVNAEASISVLDGFEPTHPSPNNNGTSTLGYAIAIVENGSYAGVSTVNISPSAEINGPVAVVKDSDNTTTANVTFDGGGLQMLVKVTDEHGATFGRYLSLELAMSEAPAGSTITLLGDCTIIQQIKTNKEYTLDLNGHNITCDGDRALHIMGGDVTITSSNESGTIASTGAVKSSSSVIRVGDNSGEARTAKLTINANVTIAAETCYGVTVFGSKTTETLTVNGKIATIDYPAIGGNGSAGYGGTTITINEGAEVSSEKELAIYQPQNGTLTVNGKVSGNGGIELKAGSLNVGSAAIVTATGTPTHKPYSSGSSTLGYAIAIVENGDGYEGVSAVDIDNSAKINGIIAQLKDSDKDGFSPTYNGDAVTKKVAAIGNDEYFTVKDAIGIVPSEGSVRLLDALTLTTPLVMDVVKTYTLNLDGKTLTGSGCAALQITNGHVTLDGIADSKVTVSVTAPQTSPQAAILMGSDTGSSRSVSLTINKNVTVDGGTLTSGIMLAGDVTRETLTVNGTVQATNHSAIIGSKDANKGGTTIHIAKDATVTATDAVAIYHPQSGDLLVDGKVIGVHASDAAGAIEMKGGDLTVTSTATITAAGTMSHTANADAPSTNGFAVALVENPAFTGVGKVNIDKSAIKNDGVVACLIDSKNDNVAEPMFVGDVTMVAETNISEGRGDKYDTLPHAIAAAAASGEVKLLDDLTLANTFTISKAITLNMDDYSLINSHESAPAVNIEANVTLKNGGVMSEQINDPEEDKANAGIKVTSGTVTLQQMNVKTGGVSLDVVGGTVTADKASTFSSTKDNTIVLSGGTLDLDLSSKVYNYSSSTNKNAIAATGNAALNVKSTVVISSDNGNAIDWNSTGALTVAGGKVSGAEAVHANNGAVTISGGTFTGTGNALEIANASCTPSIKGGTFICGKDAAYLPIKYTPGTPASGFIEGVNTFFSKHIAQALCHEGYMVSQTPKNNGMYYLVSEIVINDGTNWAIDNEAEDFTIGTAKYTRNSGMGANGTKFGTLCLPFSFNTNAATGMKFYEVNRIDDDILYLGLLSGEIEAGTPVVFELATVAYGVEITSSGATVSYKSPTQKNNLVGTYSNAIIEGESNLEGVYYLNSDAFHHPETRLTIPAFRAYIKVTSAKAKPAVLYIHTDEDAVNGIETVFERSAAEAIYDLQGRKLNDLQSGMNIMKMKDGRTIKVYVK